MHSFRLLRSTIASSAYIRKAAASNYRRPQLPPRSDQLQTLKTGLFQQRTELSTSEWDEIRSSLIANYKHLNAQSIDAVILSICSEPHQLPLAKDYIRHLRDCGIQPNAATLGRLLRVYNAAYHARADDINGKLCQTNSLSATEQQEILEIVSALRGEHTELDATTCENLIHGLVATEQWPQAQELLEMMKFTAAPSVSAYTELTLKAFNGNNDLVLGWRLLDDMMAQRKQPKCEVFLALLQAIARNPSELLNNLDRFFEFLGQHDLALTEKVVRGLEQLVADHPTVLSVSSTTLNRLGKCGECGEFMAHVSISDAEFQQLSDSFLNKVLIRNDVFQKSTPEEVERFKLFVSQSAPYDCVIDGLNVAYSMGAKKPKQVLANLLASVVRYFHTRQKRVLVLGRRHMNNWPKDVMNFVHKNASVFLTNNLTHDDPFLLYATLKSGKMTDFFSRDLMRSHAHLLGPELKSIFRLWQQEHQYSLVTQTESGKIIVKAPIHHLICAHKVKNTWHLPCTPNYSINPADTFEVPEKWLCLKTQKIK